MVTKITLGKSATGQRGKVAEKKVREFLERLSASKVDFDFERLPDARSAMGRLKAQVADFAFFLPGFHGVIEVKEVDHEFRLPAKNFTKDQENRMHKRQLAGGAIVFLVYHTPTQQWRMPDFNWIREERDTSWNLGSWPLHPSCASALRSYFYHATYLFN